MLLELRRVAYETLDKKHLNQISVPSGFCERMGLVGGAHSRGLINMVQVLVI